MEYIDKGIRLPPVALHQFPHLPESKSDLSPLPDAVAGRRSENGGRTNGRRGYPIQGGLALQGDAAAKRNIASFMKIAVMADIHGNLEALRACLAHAEREGACLHAFLGDLVGYGADPLACLDVLADHAAKGALLVMGNHDEAALGGLCEDMNAVAREATYWTRAQLGSSEREFLAGLPFTVRHDDLLFVHASADAPEKWEYVASSLQARRCIRAAQAAVTFAGHVHHQALYFATSGGVGTFKPVPGVAIPLAGRRRWLAIVGSVGQPRDGDSGAAYALFDDVERMLTYFRVPYDYITASRKIIAAGLPARLAQRLQRGE